MIEINVAVCGALWTGGNRPRWPVGMLASPMTWIVFGAAVIGQSYQYFTWQVVLYAALSLTVIRMLPMFVSLAGTGETTDSKLFLGWFGPRGLASLVFAIIVYNTDLPNKEILGMVVVCTVFLSAILHGVTAVPLANALAAKVARTDGGAGK